MSTHPKAVLFKLFVPMLATRDRLRLLIMPSALHTKCTSSAYLIVRETILFRSNRLLGATSAICNDSVKEAA